MPDKITEFEIESDRKVSWLFGDCRFQLIFESPVMAYLVEHRSEVIVVGDAEEFGDENLLVYTANGELRLRPKMPVLEKPVEGVYSIWYRSNSDKQELILNTEMYNPYDTGCTFDINNGTFSDFHPSK